jgi:hypothetical protein
MISSVLRPETKIIPPLSFAWSRVTRQILLSGILGWQEPGFPDDGAICISIASSVATTNIFR